MRRRELIAGLGSLDFEWEGKSRDCLSLVAVAAANVHKGPAWEDFMSNRTVPATLAAVMFMALGFPAADAQPKPQPPQFQARSDAVASTPINSSTIGLPVSNAFLATT